MGINQRSMPGYHLRSFPQAAKTFDAFHCQILHGDISMNLRHYRNIIGHVQIAGVPERNEPDASQEVNFPCIFNVLRSELLYTGHIGCEYIPRAGTEQGLGWLDNLDL